MGGELEAQKSDLYASTVADSNCVQLNFTLLLQVSVLSFDAFASSTASRGFETALYMLTTSRIPDLTQGAKS